MHNFLILFLIFCSFFPIHTVYANDSDNLFEEGVSWSLASFRKQMYQNPTYHLFFNIPENKDVDIDGSVDIQVTLDHPQKIILDYRNPSKSIHLIRVNGHIVKDSEINNEHICIAKRHTSKGVNKVSIQFTAGNQSLNRHEDLLYTLLVPDRARTLFPCFDQPNMKAVYTLQLEIPEYWRAVSNTNIQLEKNKGKSKEITFNPTEPLSTYLFSFVVGRFEKVDYQDERHHFSAYHRETDTAKIAQLQDIFLQVATSLDWLEEYTGISYPFAKYDFIILPGFQYGGMEHTGATLYNDTRIFLNKQATTDEKLARIQLIAHETAHMWFGDLVTMDWFDDVWTKEVFANYFAACISEPLFPDFNHNLNWMKTYAATAMSEDRTAGTTPIHQPLDNLKDAGLVYSQIIYNKAPIMMKKMVELMGKEAFRTGIREYLSTYAYSNATWNNLIDILEKHTNTDIKSFSDVWVNAKGLPTLLFENQGNKLIITQNDLYGRGLIWPQRFNVTICGELQDTTVEINMKEARETIPLNQNIKYIWPNSDGRGYGLFIPDEQSLSYMLDNVNNQEEETKREASLMLLYENYLLHNIKDDRWCEVLLETLKAEKNALIASTIVSYLGNVISNQNLSNVESIEQRLAQLSETHTLPSCRLQLMRLLISKATTKSTVQKLYQIWSEKKHSLLSENDYTILSYELSIRMPERSQTILATQRNRLTNADRLRQFDFISRSVNANSSQRDQFFQELLIAENRRVEPWAVMALRYLNHPLYGDAAVKYIRPALDALKEIQRTGDIFFPTSWCYALLGNYRSQSALHELNQFFQDNPNYPEKLKNKILQASYQLMRIGCEQTSQEEGKNL